MDLYLELRKLAKSSNWQQLYYTSKEIASIHIFENQTDLSDIQFTFLRYLSFYSSIFTDIALGDIDEKVLEHEIYEDSYMLWKNKKDTKKKRVVNSKEEKISGKTSRWVFKKPKSE